MREMRSGERGCAVVAFDWESAIKCWEKSRKGVTCYEIARENWSAEGCGFPEREIDPDRFLFRFSAFWFLSSSNRAALDQAVTLPFS